MTKILRAELSVPLLADQNSGCAACACILIKAEAGNFIAIAYASQIQEHRENLAIDESHEPDVANAHALVDPKLVVDAVHSEDIEELPENGHNDIDGVVLGRCRERVLHWKFSGEWSQGLLCNNFKLSP